MGILIDPINRLKEMLSECVGFQAWAGVDEEADPAAEALAKIYIDGLPLPEDADALTADELSAYRPYAILYPHEGDSYEAERVGQPGCFDIRGSAVIVLSKSYTAGSTPEAMWRELAGQIESIADNNVPDQPGLVQMSRESGNLQIRSIRPDFFGRTPLNERKDYGDAYDVLLVIQWD